MTTARVLIQAAYREGNLIPIGATPNDDENSEALERLNRYIRGVFGFEMGEPLVDWPAPAPQRTAPVAANFPQAPWPQSTDAAILTSPVASDMSQNVSPYPPKNSRIVWGGKAALKVYFPEQPDDGSRMSLVVGALADLSQVLTLDGNSRTIEGAPTQAQPTPPTNKEWLYRADVADWRIVEDMAIDDECPFPNEHDDLWICLLSIRLAPRYNKAIMPETQAIAKVALARLKAKYRQAVNTVYGSQDYPRSLQSYISGQWWW